MFISRKRLVERILADGAPCTVLQAGSSYGKSVLLRQLIEHDEHVVVVPGPSSPGSTFADALALAVQLRDLKYPIASSLESVMVDLGRMGCVLALDDFDEWPHEIHVAVQQACNIASNQRIVVASRTRLETLGEARWQRLTAVELAFTRTEVAELLSGLAPSDMSSGASTLFECTDGWPGPTSRAAALVRRATDPIAELGMMARSDSLLDAEVRTVIAAVDPAAQSSLSALTALSSFDDLALTHVGGDAFAQMVRRAGLPLVPVASDWYRVPPQCRRALRRLIGGFRSPGDDLLAHLVQSGRPMVAINACLGAGEQVRAAELLANMSSTDEQMLPPDELNAAIDMIGDAVEQAPRCLYVQSHVNAVNGDSFVGMRAIERAVEIHSIQDPELNSDDHLEALLTLGMFHAFERRHDQTNAVLAKCSPRVQLNEPVANTARFHELAALHALALGDAQLDDAYQHLQKALTIWRKLGHTREAASTAFRLATAVMDEMGRRQEALQLLESVPEIGPLSPLMKARLTIERAKLLPYLGRADEVPALLEEPRGIAKLLGQDWILGFASMVELIAATFVDNDDRIVALAEQVHRSDWNLQTAEETAAYQGEIAVSLNRAGQQDLARQFLQSAAPHVAGWYRDMATAFLGASSDNAASAYATLEDLSVDADVLRSERWAIEFHRAIASLHLDRPEDALKHLKESRREAAALGDPTLVDTVEWRRLPLFETQTAGATPGAVRPFATGQTLVSVFGPFRVQRDRQDLAVTGQLGRTLLKNLVVNDGRLIIDQVVDVLWPDVDLSAGRRRLRNVLARLREACGNVVVRDGDLIVLDDLVNSDYGQAMRLARNAMQSRAPAELAAAIDLTDRPLLPDDLYADWAEQARLDHRAFLIRLLDAQADIAEAAGDPGLASQALIRADRLELVPGRRHARIDRLSR